MQHSIAKEIAHGKAYLTKKSKRILLALFCCLTAVPFAVPSDVALAQEAAAVPDPNSISPPQLRSDIILDYPEEYLSLDKPPVGTVELLITIDEAGSVSFAQAVTYTSLAFANAATVSIAKTSFEPARLADGTAIAVEIGIDLVFEPPVVEKVLETAQIKGTIFSRGNKNVIAGATITVADTDLQTVSDTDGKFVLSGIPASDVTIRILASDHDIYTIREKLAPGDSIGVEYFVRPKYAGSLRLVVQGERQRREVSRQTVSLKEIVQIPGIGQDAIKVVQILPGVATPSDVSGDLIVRGSNDRDNFLEIDGLPVPYIFHLSSIASVLSTFSIDRIDFYPSNFSVRYGNATGGAFIVESRDPDTENWRGSVNVGTLLAEAYAEGPVTDNVAVYVGVRRSYFDAILKAALPDNTGFNFTTAPQFYDYQAKAIYQAAPGHSISMFVNGANDRLGLLFDEEQLADPEAFRQFALNQGFHLGRIRYKYQPDASLYNRFMIGAGSQNIQFDVDDGSLKFKLFTDIIRIREELSKTFDSGTTVRLGSQIDFSRTRADVFLPRPPRKGEFDYDFLTAERVQSKETTPFNRYAIYGEAEQNLADMLTITAGLHATKLNLASYWLADPRGQARLALGTDTTLKAGVGLYQQFPQVQNFIPEAGGNPADKEPGAERSIHYLLGIEQEIPGGFYGTLEVYYKDMKNLLTENSDIFADERFINNGLGRAYGVEVLVKKKFSEQWFGWLSYSYSRSERKLPGEEWTVSQFDQPHIFNGVLSYSVTSAWRVGARYRYASGNPDFTTDGAIFYSDQQRYIPILSETRNMRQPAYQRLDIRTDYTWLMPKAKITAYFEILNTYLHDNPLGKEEAYDYSEFAYVNSFPILPNFGVKADF